MYVHLAFIEKPGNADKVGHVEPAVQVKKFRITVF